MLEEIPKDMETEYESTMQEMLLKYKEIAAPAMPCYGGPRIQNVESGDKTPPTEEISEKKKAKSEKRKAKLEDKNFRAQMTDFDDLVGGDLSEVSTADDDELKFLPDKWILNRDVLMRVHTTPRKTLFALNGDPNDPCPLPLAYLDIMRRTDTSQSSRAESVINDYWTDPQMARRELADETYDVLFIKTTCRAQNIIGWMDD